MTRPHSGACSRWPEVASHIDIMVACFWQCSPRHGCDARVVAAASTGCVAVSLPDGVPTVALKPARSLPSPATLPWDRFLRGFAAGA
eukprot:366490-Chlamydomonas_euryale.AAC.26